MTDIKPRRHKGRPTGATRYERTDAEILARIADRQLSAPARSLTEAIRQVTGKSDPSFVHRLRRKFRAQQTALMAVAADRRNQAAVQTERGTIPMIGEIAIPLATAIAGAVVGSSCSCVLSRTQQKAARIPPVRIEFADIPAQDGQGGPVGFRNLWNEFALRVSGTLQNGGSVPALGLRLDIYHYQTSKARPTHEIIGVPVADMLQPGKELPWSRTITLDDVTVDHPQGYYQSGHIGFFNDGLSYQHYHFHVVFSWTNPYGEKACAIYGMENVIDGAIFKGTRMVFVGQARAYDPRKQFPREWRDEIKAKERSLKRLMAAPAGAFSPATPEFYGA